MPVIYFRDKYKEGYACPNMEETPEKDKQLPEYNRKISEWLYSLYTRDKTEISSDTIAKIDTLRAYADGKQSSEPYKEYFSGTGSQPTDPIQTTPDNLTQVNDYFRKGWMNIDWENLPSFIPTLLTAIKGTTVDNDYDIKADPIDYDSGIEEDRLMVAAYVDSKFGPLFNQLGSIGGIPPQENIPAMDFDELEQYKKEGVFKEPYIREHEKLLQHTQNISNWDDIIRPKVIDDLLAVGYAFIHAKYSKATSKVEWEYVDPRDVVMQYSKNSDFNDTDFCGMLRWKTISELRACSDYISDGKKTGITEKELKDIASTYKTLYSNPDFTTKSYYNSQEKVINYDDFKVLEFVTYWRDVNTKKEIEYTNKFGKTRLYPYNDSVKKLGDREKIKVMRDRKLYSCTWIVGTNYVYDYGLFPNQPYSSNMPWVPLRGVKIKSKPLVHRLVPVEDQFVKAWCKMVNGFAKASEGGFAIDVTRLAMNDPNNFNPLGVVKAWREDNIFFYQTSGNGFNVGGTPVPINLIPGNLKELVEPHMNHLNWCISFAENLTGVPIIMLGATPKQDSAVGVTQMSLESASNSLRDMLEKVKSLKQNVATGSSQMIQLSIKYDDRGEFEYSKIIGRDNISYLKNAMYLPLEYGITMRSRPTRLERESVIKAADDALLNGRNGQPGITIDQNLYIKEQVFAGANLGELRYTLRKWQEKDAAKKLQEKKDLIKQQTDGQNEAIKIKSQEDQKLEALQMKRMAVEIDLKTRSQMMIDNNKSIRTIDEQIVAILGKLYGEAGILQAEQMIQNNNQQAPPLQVANMQQPEQPIEQPVEQGGIQPEAQEQPSMQEQ